MKPVTVTSFILAGLWASSTGAQPSAGDDAASLRAELDALRERIDELETESADSGSFADRVDISGDLRYRHESINDDARPYRNRHRIRARVRFDGQVTDDLTVNLTLATGGSNPVSANQTLGNGFSRKDIGVDRAFFDWSITESLGMRGGKMANPMRRAGGHHLIFDSDLNPEGLALSYEKNGIFINIGGFWTEERSGEDDALLAAFQGGYGFMLGDSELTLGASYYDYSNTQGFPPYIIGLNGGNSVDSDGNLVNDYNLVEVFAELDLDLGMHPLLLFADVVENTEADALEQGFAVGARWRRASDPGEWDVRWAYQDLEADAVLSLFTDSDFGGGGTDSKGHVFRGTYVLRDGISLAGTYFVNERGEGAGNKRDYNRLQLDVSFSF
jgi:hypothetical protein